MPTMTKLPSESFWPLGPPDNEIRIPFPKLTSGSSSSIASPLTLPRGVTGFFDHVGAQGSVPTRDPSSGGMSPHSRQGGRVYSPLSPGVKGLALQSASFLSPNLLPAVKGRRFQFDQHRSSSLPPSARNGITSPRVLSGMNFNQDPTAGGLSPNSLGPVADGSRPPMGFAPAAHPRSISADAASTPSHVQMVQRLAQQNARMREAWEAERKYLEANRERAEEVYKEERALMEEERIEWETEKATLLAEIGRLQQQVLALGGGVVQTTNGMRSPPRVSSSNKAVRADSPGLPRGSDNGLRSLQEGSRPEIAMGLPISQNGNSSVPKPGPRAADLASPRLPNGPNAPTSDFLKPDGRSEAETGPVPIVDVKEIDPELDSIPIKATSVKKATFIDAGSRSGSTDSSRSLSPPAHADQPKAPRPTKEQTLQVLAADEAHRLTMHAGHTPNHSLSSLPTVASSGIATAATTGGDSTPTGPRGGDAPSQGVFVRGESDGAAQAPAFTRGSDGTRGRGDEALLEDHPEPLFQPSGDDTELKGPLMVRNMPAHDEIFFQKLSDKLEEVRKDDVASLPAVLKDSELAEEEAAHLDPAERRASGSGGSGSEGSGSSPQSGDDEEFEVPLKFKKRLNFGAPFGEFR